MHNVVLVHLTPVVCMYVSLLSLVEASWRKQSTHRAATLKKQPSTSEAPNGTNNSFVHNTKK